jgi:hypothetical protein
MSGIILHVYVTCNLSNRIPEAVFKSRSFDLNIELFELHTIY